MDALMTRFQSLTEREQTLVKIGGLFLGAALFYGLIWSPLDQSLVQKRAAIGKQEELLSWVQRNSQRAQQLKTGSNNKQGFSGSLTQATNRAAAQHQISISRLQPQGEQLQVWVDQADFNAVLAWLRAMETQGIAIVNVDLSEGGSAGQVKVRRLVLSK